MCRRNVNGQIVRLGGTHGCCSMLSFAVCLIGHGSLHQELCGTHGRHTTDKSTLSVSHMMAKHSLSVVKTLVSVSGPYQGMVVIIPVTYDFPTVFIGYLTQTLSMKRLTYTRVLQTILCPSQI
jgi:hypothetical protein